MRDSNTSFCFNIYCSVFANRSRNTFTRCTYNCIKNTLNYEKIPVYLSICTVHPVIFSTICVLIYNFCIQIQFMYSITSGIRLHSSYWIKVYNRKIIVTSLFRSGDNLIVSFRERTVAERILKPFSPQNRPKVKLFFEVK